MTSFEAQLALDIPPHTLILGTAPSAASLSLGQFYGHPQNAFWRLVGDHCGFSRASTPYDAQLRALNHSGFALWDVIASCDRATSLDSDIRNVIPNSIDAMLHRAPSISRIIFNGRTAASLFKRHFGTLLASGEYTILPAGDAARAIFPARSGGTRTLTIAVMPSTSPACTVSYEEKSAQWRTHCFIEDLSVAASDILEKNIDDPMKNVPSTKIIPEDDR